MPAELLAAERFGWQSHNLGNLQTLATGDPQAVAALVTALESAAPTAELLAQAVRDVPGYFAAIIKGPDFCCAIVDHCRSSPIFYSDDAVSNDAHLLRARRHLNTPNADGVTDAAMAGFVTGCQTLFQGLHQLEAGSLLIWTSATTVPAVTRYRSYMPGPMDQRSEDLLVEEFLDILDGAIARTIAQADGRPIWVPLSGGRDSRILLAKFVEQGYDNLFAFTYGPRGNDEMRAAKIIAERLNLCWTFVPSRPAAMREFFARPDRNAYWAYCDGLSAVPNFQDLLTLRQFEAEGALPEDAIIVNGQTGDFISGGHIPASLMQSAPGPDSLFDAIVGKHFSLWNSLKTPDRLDAIRARVFAQLGITSNDTLDRDTAIAHYEQFEFDERQAKYVINGQRNYEFLGRDWSLPLWDSALGRVLAQCPRRAEIPSETLPHGAGALGLPRPVSRLRTPGRPVVRAGQGRPHPLAPDPPELSARRDATSSSATCSISACIRDQYAPFGYGQFLKIRPRPPQPRLAALAGLACTSAAWPHNPPH